MPGVAAKTEAWAERMGHDAVYTAAQKALADYEGADSDVNLNESYRRSLHEQLADRESEVWIAEATANPELSQTALETRIRKITLRNDPEMQRLRLDLAGCQDRLDVATSNKRNAELRLRLETTRLAELGAYMGLQAAAARVAELKSGEAKT